MPKLDFTALAVQLINFASLISLVLIILLGLGKQFESVALLWIRVCGRIQTAKHKSKGELRSRPPRTPGRTRSKRIAKSKA